MYRYSRKIRNGSNEISGMDICGGGGLLHNDGYLKIEIKIRLIICTHMHVT